MASQFSKLMCILVFFHIGNNKQIFHAFLFNIRNYLPRVNNFDINQKKAWDFFFFYMPPTPKKFGNIKASKTQHFSVKTKVFFVKTEQQHLTIFHSKSFYIIFVDILCEIINP